MFAIKQITIIAILVILLSSLAFAAEEPWETLYQKTNGLYIKEEYRKAVVFAEQTLQTALANFGQADSRVAASYCVLGKVLYMMGNYSKAEACFREVLAVQTPPAADLETVWALTGLAEIKIAGKSYAEAVRLLEDAKSLLDKTAGAESLIFGEILGKQALVHLEEGKTAEAGDTLKQAMETYQKAGGMEQPGLLDLLSISARVALAGEKSGEAWQLTERSLSIIKKTKRQKSLARARVWVDQAEILSRQGNRKAKRYYQKALKIYRKKLGENHPLVARAQDGLAGFYHRTNQFSKAIPLYEQARIINKGVFGTGHPLVEANLISLGKLFYLTGDYFRAGYIYNELLELRLTKGDNTSKAWLEYSIGLAEVLLKQNSYIESERYCRQVLIQLEKGADPERIGLSRTYNILARVALGRSNLGQAEFNYRLARDIAQAAGAEASIITGDLYLTEAFLRIAEGRLAEAEPPFQKALEAAEKTYGPKDPAVAIVLESMADYYSRLHRKNELQATLRRIKSIKKNYK